MKRAGVTLCLVMMLAGMASAGPRSLIMERPAGDSLVFHYTETSFPGTTILIGGLPYRLFTGDDGTPGTPLLPSITLPVGIPHASVLSASIIDAEYRTTEHQLVAPSPRYTIADNDEAVADYRIDRNVYSRDQWFPASDLAVDTPYDLRGQHICNVRIFPIHYNPSTGRLRTLVRATVVLKFDGTAAREVQSKPAANSFSDRLLRDLLVNYDEARSWRSAPPPAPPDSSAAWFQPGHDYVRIPVTRDGWYMIPASTLTGLGVSTPDPSTFQMFCRGREIPLMIGADSSIGFYGQWHRGDSTYLDFYSDTSAYWLTWGMTQGMRYVDVPGFNAPGAKLTTFGETVHTEQNTDYYEGTGDLEIIQNGEVSGEGWVWDYFFPNTVKSFQCTLDGPDTTSLLPAGIVVRLFSTTLDYAATDHHAKFWINDSLAGELFFEGRHEGLFSANVPSSWLRNGVNQVRIQSIPTPSSPNQFYLDWIEIRYHRKFQAKGNALQFNIARNATPQRVTIRGFTNPSITVVDLLTGRRVTGGSIAGDSTGRYSITIVDTVQAMDHRYYAWTPDAALPVSGLQKKQFAGIRTSAQGADYIVITHANFLSAAQQLAAHRQSFNGVRTAVVNVQDIYDEFNYGVLSAVPIKTFLRYAAEQWPGPPPSYLLFMGDACWDFHHYMSSTTQVNYVPAYGVPSGDNWFVSFDSVSSFIPSMSVGRIPASDQLQAQRTVAKIIAYDNVPPGDWIKRFLFITGGGETEQPGFKSLSESLINGYVVPPPVGGSPLRVFKSSVGVIDGENKALLKSLVKDGLVFMNFLGHSGGAVWDVSIGDPNELENTNGLLPFVCSVSCNVGAFAEPSRSVLSEEFVLADNRGACAMWASSSLGYATLGTTMVEKLLQGITADSLRSLGDLTTLARLRLWQESPQSQQRIAMVNLNPLIGDPLTRLALPLKPDLVVTSGDISIEQKVPTPRDSTLTLGVTVRNWGLVPSDSVTVAVSDLYNGSTSSIGGTLRRPPTFSVDSVAIPWDASYQAGKHTVTVTLDPGQQIGETNESNNIAAHDVYVYANTLAIVRPLENMVVAPGIQTLVVTSPLGRDSAGFQYYFEIDTVETFDSAARDTSGPVGPGIVSGQWQTPPLGQGRVYFWRARTQEGGVFGNWVTSAVVVDSVQPPAPAVRVRQKSRRQFNVAMRTQTAPTDSGVTIEPGVPVQITSRSLGYRANANEEYYSIIRVNEQVITGYWWAVGSSFMTIRLDDFSGDYEFRPFDVVNQAVQADSMAAFLKSTPAGDYVAISVVFDGKTNVSESLYVMLESLGSTMIRSVVPGQSWAFIARKGTPASALESLTNDSAVVSLQVPNVYRFGTGALSMPPASIPQSWDHLHRVWSGPSGTSVSIAITGEKPGGARDTLSVLPPSPGDVDLTFLNAQAGIYSSMQFHALLSSNDPLVTPVLSDWWVDLIPKGDLAVSARSIGPAGAPSLQQGQTFNFPVTVYNIGYRIVDSASVLVSLYDRFNKSRTIATGTIGAIAPGDSATTSFALGTDDFPRHVTLAVSVAPAGGTDLVAANNEAYYMLDVSAGLTAGMQVFADGIQLMDGDYVSPRPHIVIRPSDSREQSLRSVHLSIDDVAIGTSMPGSAEGSFVPELSDGAHLLQMSIIDSYPSGGVDTLRSVLTIHVASGLMILHPLNYPNPFRSDTYFTFVLTGTAVPDELRISIFTVSGRKIRELDVPMGWLQLGFNKVHWDGRDDDGDEVANGYYFYRIQVQGGGKTASIIERLARIR